MLLSDRKSYTLYDSNYMTTLKSETMALVETSGFRGWGRGWDRLRGVLCEGCESKGKKEVEWDSWMEKEVGGGVAVRFELETPETERRTRGRCTGISRFIALQLSHFLQIEGLWKPCMEQVLSVSFFQQYLLTLCLCVTLW